MLKRLARTVQWEYTWPYVFLIAIAVASLVPHSSQEMQQVTNGASSHSADDYLSWIESAQFWGAMATCAIAAFAFFQVRDFRRSNERQLRAYVWLDATEIHNVGVGSKPSVKIEMRNAGQTPAHDVAV